MAEDTLISGLQCSHTINKNQRILLDYRTQTISAGREPSALRRTGTRQKNFITQINTTKI